MLNIERSPEGYRVVMAGEIYESLTAKQVVRIVRDVLDLPVQGRPVGSKKKVEFFTADPDSVPF